MRRTVFFLFVFLLAGASTTNSSAMKEVASSPILASASSRSQTSLDTHLAALESHQKQMMDIQIRAQLLQDRLVYLAKKPHMDPKGFRRDSAQRMFGHLTNEMKKIEQKITWHREQMRQLQG